MARRTRSGAAPPFTCAGIPTRRGIACAAQAEAGRDAVYPGPHPPPALRNLNNFPFCFTCACSANCLAACRGLLRGMPFVTKGITLAFILPAKQAVTAWPSVSVYLRAGTPGLAFTMQTTRRWALFFIFCFSPGGRSRLFSGVALAGFALSVLRRFFCHSPAFDVPLHPYSLPRTHTIVLNVAATKRRKIYRRHYLSVRVMQTFLLLPCRKDAVPLLTSSSLSSVAWCAPRAAGAPLVLSLLSPAWPLQKKRKHLPSAFSCLLPFHFVYTFGFSSSHACLCFVLLATNRFLGGVRDAGKDAERCQRRSGVAGAAARAGEEPGRRVPSWRPMLPSAAFVYLPYCFGWRGRYFPASRRAALTGVYRRSCHSVT